MIGNAARTTRSVSVNCGGRCGVGGPADAHDSAASSPAAAAKTAMPSRTLRLRAGSISAAMRASSVVRMLDSAIDGAATGGGERDVHLAPIGVARPPNHHLLGDEPIEKTTVVVDG